jgi:hypothetical protein
MGMALLLLTGVDCVSGIRRSLPRCGPSRHIAAAPMQSLPPAMPPQQAAIQQAASASLGLRLGHATTSACTRSFELGLFPRAQKLAKLHLAAGAVPATALSSSLLRPAQPERCPAFQPRWHTFKTAAAVAVSIWCLSARPALAAVTTVTSPAGGTAMLRSMPWRTVAKTAAWVCSTLIAISLKQAGPSANAQRVRGAQPIKCPWPFVLVAAPWTELGRRSLEAGFHDWQTWVLISFLLLII